MGLVHSTHARWQLQTWLPYLCIMSQQPKLSSATPLNPATTSLQLSPQWVPIASLSRLFSSRWISWLGKTFVNGLSPFNSCSTTTVNLATLSCDTQASLNQCCFSIEIDIRELMASKRPTFTCQRQKTFGCYSRDVL